MDNDISSEGLIQSSGNERKRNNQVTIIIGKFVEKTTNTNHVTEKLNW